MGSNLCPIDCWPLRIAAKSTPRRKLQVASTLDPAVALFRLGYLGPRRIHSTPARLTVCTATRASPKDPVRSPPEIQSKGNPLIVPISSRTTYKKIDHLTGNVHPDETLQCRRIVGQTFDGSGVELKESRNALDFNLAQLSIANLTYVLAE